MKKTDVIDIQYTKTNGDTSERTIVIHTLPTPNVRAIDVTDMADTEKVAVVDALGRYHEYCRIQENLLFSFEDFCAQELPDVEASNCKWRSFKKDRIVVM